MRSYAVFLIWLLVQGIWALQASNAGDNVPIKTAEVLAADVQQHGYPTYSFRYCELPQWFRFRPQTTDSLNIIVGISDPGLADSLAVKQAMARLKMMAALNQNVHIHFNNSLFRRFVENTAALNHHTNQSKFVRFNRMHSSLELHPGELQVMDSTTTVYGERIIFAHYMPHDAAMTANHTPEKILVDIDFMAIEFSEGPVFSTDQFLHLHADIDSLSLGYTMYKSGEVAELHSSLDELKLKFPFDYYKYLLSERISPGEASVSAKLYYGLWKAFIESYCLALSNYHFEQNIRQQFVQDSYQEMVMSLAQEGTRVRLSPNIKWLDAGENALHLELEFVPYD